MDALAVVIALVTFAALLATSLVTVGARAAA